MYVSTTSEPLVPFPAPTGQGGVAGNVSAVGAPRTPPWQFCNTMAVTRAVAGSIVVVTTASAPVNGPAGVAIVQPVAELLSESMRILSWPAAPALSGAVRPNNRTKARVATPPSAAREERRTYIGLCMES